MYTKQVMVLGTQTQKHFAFFLTAISFILAQSIVEVVLVYFSILFFEGLITTLLYEKWILISTHLTITIILIMLAKPFAKKFYKPKMV